MAKTYYESNAKTRSEKKLKGTKIVPDGYVRCPPLSLWSYHIHWAGRNHYRTVTFMKVSSYLWPPSSDRKIRRHIHIVPTDAFFGQLLTDIYVPNCVFPAQMTATAINMKFGIKEG